MASDTPPGGGGDSSVKSDVPAGVGLPVPSPLAPNRSASMDEQDEFTFKVSRYVCIFSIVRGNDKGLTRVTCGFSSFTAFCEAVGAEPDQHITYIDDVGDCVAIEVCIKVSWQCDRDLREAVVHSRRLGQSKFVVCVGGRDKVVPTEGDSSKTIAVVGGCVCVGLVLGFILKKMLD